MDNKKMLNYLAENSINVFLYEDTGSRGLSSALDIALAVQRPVGISNAVMFRHLFDVDPSIRVDTNDLATIMRNGFDPLRQHCNEWNAENLSWEYERIFNSIFTKLAEGSKVKRGIVGTLRFNWDRLLSRPAKSFSWLDNSNEVETNDLGPTDFSGYQPIQISSGLFFNRILDNSARKLYKPAVDKLTELVPKTMRKKIPEANIQQAFVFDTVYRHLSSRPDLKALCVGSHEDTASMSLRRMGFRIEEIDPTMNYFLQEFFTKPTTLKNSYGIVFATSVIEHDPDDESFVECVAGLLAPR
jgi:hypothetical protein